MDVSIVIVSYNTCRILDQCIASIKRETVGSYEILVVDNASIDDSRAMLREKHPDVILIENSQNAGFAKANNQGFAIAQGRYFFMLNSDTVILDHAIDKLAAFMEKNRDVGICGPRNIGRDEKLQYNCDHFPGVWNAICYYTNLGSVFPKSRIFNANWMRYWDYSGIRDVDRIVGCSLMIRSDLYRSLSGLDEKYFMYFEETDFCYRASRRGWRTTYYPDAVIVHYGGESTKTVKTESIISNTVASYFQKSLYYYYQKNYGRLSQLSIRFLHLAVGLLILLRSTARRNREKKKHGILLGEFLIASSLNIR